MPKTQTQFVCQNCGRTNPRAMGRCPSCGSWGTMVEEIIPSSVAAPARAGPRGLGGVSEPRRLSEIEGDVEAAPGAADRRVCPRVGRGSGARFDRPDRRRPGDRQIDPDAAGRGGNGARQRRCCMSPAKNRNGRSRCAPCACCASEDNGKPDFPQDLLLVTETNLDMILEHINQVRPAWWWSISSRPPTCRAWNLRPARSARCASAPTGCARWPNPAASLSS